MPVLDVEVQGPFGQHSAERQAVRVPAHTELAFSIRGAAETELGPFEMYL